MVPLSSDYYIGIDVGTGSARACIIDDTGDIVGLAAEDISTWEPKPGYYEQSTDDIWRSICKAVKKAVAESRININLVRGIGFDATCSLAVFAHDSDEPISITGPDFETNHHNVILWLDHRAEKEVGEINSTGHNLLKYVGGKMSIEMEVPKLLWLKNHMPRELFNRCKFYDLTDALEHLATGNEKRSFCSVVCKQGFVPLGVDGSTVGWQEDFLKDIGLEDLTDDNFKRLGGVHRINGEYLSAGDLAGHLCQRAAQDLHLPAGIPIGSGVIDAYAGWIGTVGAKVADLEQDDLDPCLSQSFSRLAVVAGTSTCHLLMSPKPIFVDGIWGPYRDCVIPGNWMAEGGQSATGQLLKHVLETHPAYKQAICQANSADMDVYDFLNGHLAGMKMAISAPSIAYLGRYLFFYGDLWGNRSPIGDSNMSGSIVGLSADVSLENLALYYYGTMEFIALQTSHIVAKMNESGHDIRSIFMSGSQSKNNILMSLIATACNMPVVIPQYSHAAVCHGAAMLGAKAATADKTGKTEMLWSIMKRMSKPGRIIRPTATPGVKELLKVKYKVFHEQCERQRAFRMMVDSVLDAAL